MTDGNQCAVWEFTLPKRALTVGAVHALLRRHCKAYTFQLERGDASGYEHYQGRLSLFKKIRATNAPDLFPETGIHISPTSNNARKGPPFYCLKEQTRLEGPWTEKDFVEAPKLCWPYNEEDWDNPLPWQKEMFERLSQRIKRTIYCIIDHKGCNGKTSFIKKAKAMGLAREIPAMTSMEDIMAWVMSFPPHKGYMIDMPRAMPKCKLAGFYAGIESLKNGYAYDKRYHGKDMDFDSPNVVVFSNKKPKRTYLSMDRWRLLTISDDHRLIDYCFSDAVQKTKKRKHNRKSLRAGTSIQDEDEQEGSVSEVQTESDDSLEDSDDDQEDDSV